MQRYYLIPTKANSNVFGYPVLATDYHNSTHDTRVMPITVPNYHEAYRYPNPSNTYRNHNIHVISAHTKWGIQRLKKRIADKYNLYATRILRA